MLYKRNNFTCWLSHIFKTLSVHWILLKQDLSSLILITTFNFAYKGCGTHVHFERIVIRRRKNRKFYLWLNMVLVRYCIWYIVFLPKQDLSSLIFITDFHFSCMRYSTHVYYRYILIGGGSICGWIWYCNYTGIYHIICGILNHTFYQSIIR